MKHVSYEYCAGPLSLTIEKQERSLQSPQRRGQCEINHDRWADGTQPARTEIAPRGPRVAVDNLSIHEIKANNWRRFRQEASAGNYDQMVAMARKAPNWTIHMLCAERCEAAHQLGYALGFSPPTFAKGERTAHYDQHFAKVREMLDPCSLWHRNNPLAVRELLQGDLSGACLRGCMEGALHRSYQRQADPRHMVDWGNFVAQQKLDLKQLAKRVYRS